MIVRSFSQMRKAAHEKSQEVVVVGELASEYTYDGLRLNDNAYHAWKAK